MTATPIREGGVKVARYVVVFLVDWETVGRQLRRRPEVISHSARVTSSQFCLRTRKDEIVFKDITSFNRATFGGVGDKQMGVELVDHMATGTELICSHAAMMHAGQSICGRLCPCN